MGFDGLTGEVWGSGNSWGGARTLVRRCGRGRGRFEVKARFRSCLLGVDAFLSEVAWPGVVVAR